MFHRSRCGRRARAVGAVVGALAVVSVGFAPNAAANDAQSQQWYLEPMQAEQMWKVSTGKGIKVAVIDSGVNANTPSLKGQVLTGEVPKSVAYRATDDFTGHGTTMAELIAGTGAGGGLQGLAPGAKIVPYRIELEGLKGGADEKKKTPDDVDAIRAAADTDAQIISMSFGGDGPSSKQEAAIEYAASKGKLLIAAVGNEGRDEGRIGYPAAYPYVLGVAAVDSSGTVPEFSSYGNYVDLSAPGEGFPGWCDGNLRSYCDDEQGTSAAAAITSASAALIWSAHPDWTVNQVTRSLIDTASRTWAKDDPSKYAGYGMVRPRKVLENANYDAGPANVDPLAKDNGGDLLANSASTASSSPSPSPSTASQAPEKGSSGGTSAAGSAAESTNGGNTLWIALGAAAAAIVIGGCGVAVIRARRAR
ncbi:S8 family serine peptidase [Streptomyces sp. NBC_00481]|uniref:S8 family serine peptidase n=1 Tax=unclassified Streptomyces TaxID=2593676 RepID=UPI002DDA5876|nr:MULTISPECIES: S8 family serine peptidase [unclassified Streptomyces]WRZ01387.1 S8 family serine peptidase [Streptomyces sp. NBC_00481]